MINSYLLSGEEAEIFGAYDLPDILTKHDVYVKVISLLGRRRSGRL